MNDTNPRHKFTVPTNNSKNVSETVEKFLEEASKGLTSDILTWIQERVESSIHLWIGESLGKIKISLVVDSTVLIQSIKYHAKGKTSILYKLANNPLFPIYAPKEAEAEVLDYIERKAKKKENKTKLKEGWEKLKPVLKIKEVQDSEAKRLAKEMMHERDPKDIPFIGLYIETGAAAILTTDNDYESASVRKFNIGELNDVVAVFHRGLFSFFIMNDILPVVLEGLSKIVIAIAKVLYKFLKLIFDACVGVVSGAVDKVGELISKIPKNAQKWIGVGLLIAAAFVSFLMIFHEGARNKVTGTIKSVWDNVKPVIETITNWLISAIRTLVHYAELSGPYIGTSVEVLAEIQKHIIAISEEIKNLGLKKASYYA